MITWVTTPDMQNYEFKLMFRGLTKKMMCPVRQAKPITLSMLLILKKILNLEAAYDCVIWMMILVGSLLMLKSSNMVPKVANRFDSQSNAQGVMY